MVQDRGKNQRSQFVQRQLSKIEADITDTQRTIDRVTKNLNPDADLETGIEQSEQLKALEDRLDDLEDKYLAMVTTAGEFSEGAKVAVLESAYSNRHPIRPDQR